jgi:endonuclease YncB( thermonuclease family)
VIIYKIIGHKPFARLFLLAFILCFWLLQEKQHQSTELSDKGRNVKIIKIVDGDSLIIRDSSSADHTRIRLIGIDALEISANPKLVKQNKYSKDGLKKNLELGLKARNHLELLLRENSQIKIYNDIGRYDQYGRELVYAYRKDGTFINLKMIEAGYAKASPQRPNTYYASQFEQAYKDARLKKLGIFKAKSNY